ncbi:MAG: amidohydrolase family protein [Fimbriiglobus sp.]
MTISRREFLAVSAVALGSSVKASTPMLPVVDTHQHLWDFAKLVPPWLTPGDPKNPLAKSHTPADYAAAIEGLNVVKSVYAEVGVAAADRVKEAEYVAGICAEGKTPMRAAVIGGDVLSEGFPEYIKAYKGHKSIKGIRHMLHVETTPKGTCLQEGFIKSLRLLGELGLSFDLCIRPNELPDMVTLVEKCPDTKFILDHCGNPNPKFTTAEWDTWRKNMASMAAKKNVVCKVSGFVANATPAEFKIELVAPGINGTIEAFGIDRVMFGGDWPVVTKATSYKGWLTMLREVISNRPEADQRKLLHDNACKVYGI